MSKDTPTPARPALDASELASALADAASLWQTQKFDDLCHANTGLIVDALRAYRSLADMREREDRRFEILAWATDTFGPVAGQTNERAMRFAEEALELVHALGLPADTVTKIAARVYSRAAGDPEKEAGQAQMTLDALCAQQGINSQDEADKEFDRVRAIPREHWKARHDAKTSLGITGDALARSAP